MSRKKTVQWAHFNWFDGASGSNSEDTIIDRLDLLSKWEPIIADKKNRTRTLRSLALKGGEEGEIAKKLLEHLIGMTSIEE